MSYFSRWAACLIAAMPTLALSCPTASDLTAGIRATLDDNGYEVHRSIGSERIRMDITFGPGDEMIMEFVHGIYALWSMPIVEGRADIANADYFANIGVASTWLAPRPNARWETEGDGSAKLSSGAIYEFAVGACVYDAFDVDMTFDADGYIETYTFLPDLGIGLLVADDDGQTKNRYTYTRLEAE